MRIDARRFFFLTFGSLALIALVLVLLDRGLAVRYSPWMPHVLWAIQGGEIASDIDARAHGAWGVSGFEAGLNSPDSTVRYYSAYALSWSKDAGCVPQMTNLAYFDTDSLVRYQAICTIFKLLQDKSRPYLQKAIDDPDNLVKSTARHYLDVLDARLKAAHN